MAAQEVERPLPNLMMVGSFPAGLHGKMLLQSGSAQSMSPSQSLSIMSLQTGLAFSGVGTQAPQVQSTLHGRSAPPGLPGGQVMDPGGSHCSAPSSIPLPHSGLTGGQVQFGLHGRNAPAGLPGGQVMDPGGFALLGRLEDRVPAGSLLRPDWRRGPAPTQPGQDRDREHPT
jgi:hypothetical protein